MSSIHQDLADSASRYARRSLRSFRAQELDDFHLFAGVAVEHALKAMLAEQNAAFIADPRSFESMKLIWQQRAGIVSGLSKIRTVTADEAFARAAVLDSSLNNWKASAGELLAHRNGTAHIGKHGADDSNKVMSNFVSLVAALLNSATLKLAESAKQFWLEEHAYVEKLLDAKRSEVQKRVDHKIAVAKDVFTQFIEPFDTVEQDALIRQYCLKRDANLPFAVSDEDRISANCPACEQDTAWLGGINMIDVDVDVDHRTGDIVGGGYYVVFTAWKAGCETCHLGLDSAEELEAAGITTKFANPDEDVEDYEEFKEYVNRDYSEYLD